MFHGSGTVARMAVHAIAGVELVRVSATSGHVTVVAEPRADVAVTGGDVSRVGAALTVQGGSDAVDVRVPEGTSLAVGTRSGSVELTGDLGAVGVASDSGHVVVERATAVDVRTTSGTVEIGRVTSRCRARTESGSIIVDRTGDLAAHAESGRIHVGHVVGEVRVRTTSGRIEVGVDGPSDVAGETVDGTIVFALADGLGAAVDVETGSGQVDNQAPGGDDCQVVARTVSGRIEVRGG